MLGDQLVVLSEDLETGLEVRFRKVSFAVLCDERQVSLERVRWEIGVKGDLINLILGIETDSNES